MSASLVGSEMCIRDRARAVVVEIMAAAKISADMELAGSAAEAKLSYAKALREWPLSAQEGLVPP
eukprot:15447076-Alexandrium_andersonii.AAC.1